MHSAAATVAIAADAQHESLPTFVEHLRASGQLTAALILRFHADIVDVTQICTRNNHEFVASAVGRPEGRG